MIRVKEYYRRYSTYVQGARFPIAFLVLFVQNSIILLILNGVFMAFGSDGMSVAFSVALAVAVAIGALLGRRSSGREKGDEEI
jgi:hypothetical protein